MELIVNSELCGWTWSTLNCQQKDNVKYRRQPACLSPLDKMLTTFCFGVIDELVSELQSRFPAELLVDFSCLDPRHFTALDGEQ